MTQRESIDAGSVTATAWVPRLSGASGSILGELTGTHDDAAGGVSVLPAGRGLAVGHADGVVRLVDLVSGTDSWIGRERHDSVLQTIACNAEGTLLASCAQDRLVRFWRSETGEVSGVLAHSVSIHDLAFSPAGELLAVAGGDGAVWLWRVGSREMALRCEGHEAWTVAVDWSPRGDLLASASNDSSLRIWNAEDGTEVHRLDYGAKTFDVAWSPDGGSLAVASEDGRVSVWSRETWREQLRCEGHDDEVNCVRWSPDGRFLATGGDDQGIRIWDSETGSLIHRYPFREAYAWRLSWAPSGAFIAASLHGDIVRLWDTRDLF